MKEDEIMKNINTAKIAAFIMITIMVFMPFSRAESAKRRRKSPRQTQTASSPQSQSGLNSLIGSWKGQGNGTGRDPRQPGIDVSLNADDVVLKIESVKYSESNSEGMADVIFTGFITDIRNDVICERTWEYSIPYDMKREGENSWSFRTEFAGGEDKITLTFMPGKNALIRWEGSAVRDDNYPDEIYTFDVTCSAVKE